MHGKVLLYKEKKEKNQPSPHSVSTPAVPHGHPE